MIRWLRDFLDAWRSQRRFKRERDRVWDLLMSESYIKEECDRRRRENKLLFMNRVPKTDKEE